MTRTRYGVSPWIDAIPSKRRPAFPRYRGERDAPVVIIGAGLTGCATAYALGASGIPALVLEADRLGVAGAGRASGVFRSEPTASFRQLQARHGRRAARAIFDHVRRAALDLATTVRRLGVRADVDVQDALRVAVPDERGRPLAREAVERREAGFEAGWLKGQALSRLSSVEASEAVRLRGWGHADPYRLTLGFARAASERGVEVFEGSAVRRLNVRRRHVEVHAGAGVVRAGTVILCTREPGRLIHPLARHFATRERYVVRTAPMPAVMRRQVAGGVVLTDVAVPPHVVWRDDEHRLIVEGGDQARTADRSRPKVLVQRTGQLMYELSRLLPPISGLPPELGWDVPLATTADGVMYAGPHRNYPRHLFAWGTSHDPAQAFLASRILMRHILGRAEKDDAYFAFTRGSPGKHS